MAVAINTNVTVTKTLPSGSVTNFTNVSMYVVSGAVTTRYDVVVVNATLTTAGSLIASNVQFSSVGTHKCTFSSETNADLDVNGTVITAVYTTNVSAVSPLATTVTV